VTDARGYFELTLPVASGAADGALPNSDDVVFERAGHKSHIRENTPLVEGATHYIIELEPGAGVTEANDLHKLLFDEKQLQESQLERASEERPLDAPPLPSQAAGAAGEADAPPLIWPPPATIRVGFNCSCATCSTVEVMTLETYTKRGLNDEWFASWTPH